MGFSNRRKKEAVEFRIFEEKVYELVAAEIESGDRRTGLWARALANSDGDEVKASGLYIKYRAQSLLDEAVLEMDVLEKVVDGQEVEVEEKGGQEPSEIKNDSEKVEIAKEILREKGYKISDRYKHWLVFEPLGGRHKVSTAEELLQYAYSRSANK